MKHSTKMVFGPCPSIRELVGKSVSMAYAADNMGVGYSTLSKYVSQDHAPAPLEKLAGYILAELESGTRKAPRHQLVMVRCPHEKLELLGTFLKGMDIQFTRFEMDT